MNKIDLKSNKGVTIISLVITITIILILCSATIKMSIGNQGVITEADDTASNAEISNTIQLIEEAKVNAGIRNNDIVSIDNIARQIVLDGIASETDVTINGDSIKVIDGHNRTFIVTKNDVKLQENNE